MSPKRFRFRTSAIEQLVRRYNEISRKDLAFRVAERKRNVRNHVFKKIRNHSETRARQFFSDLVNIGGYIRFVDSNTRKRHKIKIGKNKYLYESEIRSGFYYVKISKKEKSGSSVKIRTIY